MAGMLFASTELAARIERAEAGLLRDAVAAVGLLRPERNAGVLAMGGGLAAYSGPESPLNKVIGLGLSGLPSETELASVEAFYGLRGSPVQVELSSLADPGTGALLTTRGYRLLGFENVLGRDLTATGPTPSLPVGPDVRVSRCGEDTFSLWLDTIVSGFLVPDADGVPAHESFPRETLEEVIGDVAELPGMERYLAFRGEAPAGAAGMRIQETVVQLSGASTLPGHRRRGVQAALLDQRLSDAAERGCEVAVVTTQPGSTSQRNAQRSGFQLLYARAILVLPAVAT